jgi:dihydroflavonol-4-reductase
MSELALDAGDRCVVTGASGFIGSAVVRALLRRGAKVVCAVEPGRPTPNLEGLEVEILEVDIRDATAVRAAMEGARACFHLAAIFGFWPRDPELFYAVNVDGSRTVVEAAAEAGCDRIVYTSTVATLGLRGVDAASSGANEQEHAFVEDLHGSYKRSKYVAEHEVLRLAAEGAPVVLVQPSFPVGPGDERPTPTGKVVLDFLSGRMPGYVSTSFNVAHVDDLAEGHLLAFERGRQGRSYICGGENMAMREMLSCLSELSGLPFKDRRVPGALGLGAGWISDLVEGRLLGREPHVPLEGAQMSATQMRFDDARARGELGYSSRPGARALEAAARWFVAAGRVPESRLAAMDRSFVAESQHRPLFDS